MCPKPRGLPNGGWAAAQRPQPPPSSCGLGQWRGQSGRGEAEVILPRKGRFILEFELAYLYLKMLAFPRHQRMLQPAVSEWGDLCRRRHPVQVRLSPGEDRQPLSAPGPDRYGAAEGLGEAPPQGEEPLAVGHQMQTRQELSSPPGQRAFHP